MQLKSNIITAVWEVDVVLKYVGMKIKDEDQLSGIYDTWIMLIKNNDSDVYTVGFIGKETNAESDNLFMQGNVVCPVYNDSMELEGDIYYEE